MTRSQTEPHGATNNECLPRVIKIFETFKMFEGFEIFEIFTFGELHGLLHDLVDNHDLREILLRSSECKQLEGIEAQDYIHLQNTAHAQKPQFLIIPPDLSGAGWC